MRSLGLYGDSFVDYQPIHSELQRLLIESAWSRRLEQVYRVTNYSLTGSSLYWTMRHFEATHAQHDQVLVVVTAPGRWPGTVAREGWPRPWTLSSADQCSQWLKDHPSDLQVRAVRDWYMWAQVTDHELYTHELMVNRIQTLRPDAIVIPISDHTQGLGTSLTDYMLVTPKTLRPDLIDPSLGSSSQLAQLVKDWEEQRVVCHLTPDMNDCVFLEVTASLQLGRWRGHVPGTWPHRLKWDDYYRRR